MASTGLNFTNITPDNGAIRDMGQIIMERILSPERLGSLFTIVPGVHNGDKLGVIGEYGLLGKASSGCTPDWGSDLINTNEKTWGMCGWEVAEKICYQDLLNTFVKYSLRKKTDVADLTGNDYLEEIVRPRLELAIRKMMFRYAFFNNFGSTYLDEDYADFFAMCETNGLLAAISNLTDEIISIEENDVESDWATQFAGIRVAGKASGYIDSLIANANPALRSAPNQVIYMSLAMADALNYDLLHNYPGSDLHWRALFDGITEGQYQGIRIVALPIFDEITSTYYTEGVTGRFMPFFALYTTVDNLLLGVSGNDEIADLQVWFDQTDQMNYLLARDRIGVNFASSKLIKVAM